MLCRGCFPFVPLFEVSTALPSVAPTMALLFPLMKLLVCTDNEAKTHNSTHSNTIRARSALETKDPVVRLTNTRKICKALQSMNLDKLQGQHRVGRRRDLSKVERCPAFEKGTKCCPSEMLAFLAVEGAMANRRSNRNGSALYEHIHISNSIPKRLDEGNRQREFM